jgi:hypothetical protein
VAPSLSLQAGVAGKVCARAAFSVPLSSNSKIAGNAREARRNSRLDLRVFIIMILSQKMPRSIRLTCAIDFVVSSSTANRQPTI